MPIDPLPPDTIGYISAIYQMLVSPRAVVMQGSQALTPIFIYFSRYILPIQRRDSPVDLCERSPARYHGKQRQPLSVSLREEGQSSD